MTDLTITIVMDVSGELVDILKVITDKLKELPYSTGIRGITIG